MKKYNYGGRSFAAGGAMPMEQLTEFNEGGRHEENSLGGIPQGMNADGQQNLVEEGETKFDAENYIYSDSLKVDKELAEAFNLTPSMVGKTFADASKMAGRKKSKRQGDAIEAAANEKDLTNLMEAQEAFKQARIEEKLQEIAELDPNALPALMEQGQPQGGPQEGAPQGDPAMGGQMQEAPIDEQAMMEQQMMAEQQQGGGQPSPEEMAMMEQQQNQMMGQQEGMMMNGGSLYNTMYGSGGKLPKEVLKARAQSHMSPAQADAYVQNYAGGGYMTPSYASGGKMDFEPHMMYKDGNGIQADTYQKHLSLKNEGYSHSMGYGGYTKKRSYAPGGFMGANTSMMTPGPCGGPGNPCPEKNVNYNMLEISPGGPSRIDLQNQRKEKQAQKLINSAPSTTDLKFTYPTQGNVENLGDPRFEGVEVGIPMDSGANFNRNKLGRQIRKDPTGFIYKAGDLDDKAAVDRAALLNDNRKKAFNLDVASNEFGGNLMQSGQQAGLNPMQGMNQFFNMGGMLDGSLAGQNLNLNQGLASQMRGGGKMCYGCGGKMHAYGGRMNNMPGKKFEFGAGLDIASNVLDKASTFMPPILKEVAKTAGNLAGTIANKKQGKPVTKGDYIGDVIGGITTSIPGAEKLVDTVTDVATSKNKKSQNEIKENARNNINDPLHKQVTDQDAAMVNSKQLQNANKFNNILDSTVGLATQFIKPGEKELEGASDIADFAPDGVTENVTNTVGQLGDSVPIGNWSDIDTENMPEMPQNMANGGRMYAGGGYIGTRSYGKGGGLWANIQAKKERMGSNYRPAKPGDADYPTATAIKNSQNAMGGRLYGTGSYMDVNPLYNSNNKISNFKMPQFDIDSSTDETEDKWKDVRPNIDEALEQTPLQKAALYAPIAKNLYDATLAKSDDYNPEFIPAEYVQLDSAQAIQQEKQRNAGVVAAGRAKGFNNPSNMLALNHALQGTVSNIQSSYDTKNAALKQTALTSNATQKRELAKLKQSLKMQTAEAKNLAMNEALSQAKQIAENKTSNKLSALYATMGAPDMGKNFITGNSKYKKMLKEYKKLQKEFKALKKD